MNSLGKNLQIADQIGEWSLGPHHDFHDPQGGQQPVAGSGFSIAEDDVPGLLSAQDRPMPQHFFQNVFIAHIGAQHANSGISQRDLQAHIRHGGSDDHRSRQFAAGLHIARSEQKNRIAIHHAPVRIAEQNPVSVAIEGDAQIELPGFDSATDWATIPGCSAPQPSLIFLPSGERS